MGKKKDDPSDQPPERLARSSSAASQPPTSLLILGSTNNSTCGVKTNPLPKAGKNADSVGTLVDAIDTDMNINDAESASNAGPAPLPHTTIGGRNKNVIVDVDDNQLPPPETGGEQPSMKVETEAVDKTASHDHRRPTNSFVRQTYGRYIKHLDPQDSENPETASDAGYRILATFRGENHVGQSYDDKTVHNMIALQSCARFTAPGDRIHPHDCAPETWRRYATGAIYTGANLADTISHINETHKAFYEGKNPINRLQCLKISVPCDTIVDGAIGTEHRVLIGSGDPGAPKKVVSERMNAFLNIRGALPPSPGTDNYYVNSVSVPIQEFADQVGKVRLLDALVADGLNEESSMKAKIALGLHALICEGALDTQNDTYASGLSLFNNSFPVTSQSELQSLHESLQVRERRNAHIEAAFSPEFLMRRSKPAQPPPPGVSPFGSSSAFANAFSPNFAQPSLELNLENSERKS